MNPESQTNTEAMKSETSEACGIGRVTRIIEFQQVELICEYDFLCNFLVILQLKAGL